MLEIRCEWTLKRVLPEKALPRHLYSYIQAHAARSNPRKENGGRLRALLLVRSGFYYLSVIVVVIVPVQVLNALLITAPEAMPVSISVLPFIARMPVFVAVIHVRLTMILRIFTSAFYAVVKSLSFYPLQFPRGLSPLLVAITRGRWLLDCTRSRNCYNGCCG
jgi:hypothetical protein